jgi:hypothetical protein
MIECPSVPLWLALPETDTFSILVMIKESGLGGIAIASPYKTLK